MNKVISTKESDERVKAMDFYLRQPMTKSDQFGMPKNVERYSPDEILDFLQGGSLELKS